MIFDVRSVLPPSDECQILEIQTALVPNYAVYTLTADKLSANRFVWWVVVPKPLEPLLGQIHDLIVANLPDVEADERSGPIEVGDNYVKEKYIFSTMGDYDPDIAKCVAQTVLKILPLLRALMVGIQLSRAE